MSDIADYCSDQEQEQKAAFAQDIFDVISEDNEEIQVTQQMENAAMQKKRTDECQAMMAEEVSRNETPVFYGSFKIVECLFTLLRFYKCSPLVESYIFHYFCALVS